MTGVAIAPRPTQVDRPLRIEPVWVAEPVAARSVRGGHLPPELRDRFDGDLAIPLREGRPSLVVNFVTTLDGVVAFDRDGRTGGGEVSGRFEPDRFLMGLLRAASDAVVIGAGTVRASSTRGWGPRHVHPASAAAFAAWRRELGLAPEPTVVIVTASGRLDPRHPGLQDPALPVVVATTADGAERLRDLPAHVEVDVLGEGDAVPPDRLVAALWARGHRLFLCEGGPNLLAPLLRDGLVDELFLTVAPQLAGRAPDASRLGLVEGVAFEPASAPWAHLVSVARAADHLFLRYRFDPQGGSR